MYKEKECYFQQWIAAFWLLRSGMNQGYNSRRRASEKFMVYSKNVTCDMVLMEMKFYLVIKWWLNTSHAEGTELRIKGWGGDK